MKIFFSNLQRVVVLNRDLLDGVAQLFPILKKCILPIRDLLTASSLNATHVINGSDEKWFALYTSALQFIVRANTLNQAHIAAGYTGEALLNKMDDICVINLKLSDLAELESELIRIHIAFDNALCETKGKDSIDGIAKIENLQMVDQLFTNSLFVESSVLLSESKHTKSFYIEDFDLDVDVIFSGSEFENEFFEKWLVQDNVGPTKLESFENSYTFETEENFLTWINNFRAQFQIQLGLDTLTSFFDSSSDSDINRLKQIRHDLTNIMSVSEEDTILTTKLNVWEYVYGHLNAFELETNQRKFLELKSIYDLEELSYKYNFY